MGRAEDIQNLELPDGLYAVRSSAPTEDTAQSASAGVYLTELDVPLLSVPDAVERVIRSTEQPDGMTVIVQQMVQPLLSGASFSRNPVTGLSDIVVEAIEGRGDALLQHGSDPLRWVWRNGEFIERPDVNDFSALAQDVVNETRRLSDRFGPADLEWVWDGSDIYWVQIRPITTIEAVPLFSRAISKDVMPGMIKPLVWSINVPMVNKAWVRLFTEAIGPNDLDPRTLARSFAFRSYFDMGAIGDVFELVGMPRDSLENLLGLPGAKGRMRPGLASFLKMPRMIGLGWRLLTGARRLENRRRELHGTLTAFETSDLDILDDRQILDEIEQLIELGSETAYVNIVFPLLANAYMGRLKRALEKSGYSLEEMGPMDTGEWSPKRRMDDLVEAFSKMDHDALTRVTEGDLSYLDGEASQALDRLIDDFGYLSENTNDLSTPRWRDDRLSVVALASAQIGTSTRAAPKHLRSRQEPDQSASSAIRRALSRAQRYAVLREAAGATFAYGYGLLRPRFIEIGRRLVSRRALESADDIFYLDRGQVQAALTAPKPDLRAMATKARSSMEEVQDLLMPDLIVGDTWLPESQEVEDRLVGVGVSRGRYRGTARFVQSLDQASNLSRGDVLVVEHSDVAWTPLFGIAGAVISATGGLLAHSSITAREMGIPCVASVGAARLLDGAIVLVDGFSGEVIVESRW